MQQARQIARDTGHPVSETTVRALEDTLHAALADEHAAEQLLAGRLTEPLERSGFGDWVSTDTVTPAAESFGPSPQRRPRGNEKLGRAKHHLEQAEQVLTEATKARDEALTRAAGSEEAARSAKSQVKALRRQLDEATAVASEADGRRREQATALEEAKRVVIDAQRRRADAQQGSTR